MPLLWQSSNSFLLPHQCSYRHLISAELLPGSADLRMHKSVLLQTSFRASIPEKGEGRTEFTVSPFPTKGRTARINSIQLQRKETQSTQQKLEEQQKNFFNDKFCLTAILIYCSLVVYISEYNILL